MEEDAEKFRLTELGFAWVRSAILNLHFRVFARLSERKGFWCVEFDDLKGSLQLLNLTHLRDRDKMLLRAILCVGEFGMDSFLVKLRRKTFHVVFAGRKMVMDIYFGNVLFSPFNMCANFLSLLF